MNDNTDTWEEIDRLQKEKRKLLSNIMTNVQKLKQYTYNLVLQTDKNQFKRRQVKETSATVNDNKNVLRLEESDDEVCSISNSVRNLKKIFEQTDTQTYSSTDNCEESDLKGNVSSLVKQFSSNTSETLTSQEESSTSNEITESKVYLLKQQLNNALITANSNEGHCNRTSDDLGIRERKVSFLVEQFTTTTNNRKNSLSQELTKKQSPNNQIESNQPDIPENVLKWFKTNNEGANKSKEQISDCKMEVIIDKIKTDLDAEDGKKELTEEKTNEKIFKQKVKEQVKHDVNEKSIKGKLIEGEDEKELTKEKIKEKLNEEKAKYLIEGESEEDLIEEEIEQNIRYCNSSDTKGNEMNHNEFKTGHDLNDNDIFNLIDAEDYDKKFEDLCVDNDTDNVNVEDFDTIFANDCA